MVERRFQRRVDREFVLNAALKASLYHRLSREEMHRETLHTLRTHGLKTS